VRVAVGTVSAMVKGWNHKSSSPFSCPYSPNGVEEVFCELRSPFPSRRFSHAFPGIRIASHYRYHASRAWRLCRSARSLSAKASHSSSSGARPNSKEVASTSKAGLLAGCSSLRA